MIKVLSIQQRLVDSRLIKQAKDNWIELFNNGLHSQLVATLNEKKTESNSVELFLKKFDQFK